MKNSISFFSSATVVHPVTARIWEIQKRPHIHCPLDGYGILLAKLSGLKPA
jgi:hypothetical protein